MHLFRIAVVIASASCAAPAFQWPAGTTPPPAPVVSAPLAAPLAAPLEREVRHYRDESGAIWDDRGRRLDRIP